MPTKPKHSCSHPGCPELTAERYCDRHQRQAASDYDRKRGSAASRGYDSRWRKVRRLYLSEHPLCVKCLQDGHIEPASVVDYIKPHRGDLIFFWDQSNWQSLCKRCHDRKTRTEDQYPEYMF